MKFETLYLELVNSTDMIFTLLAGLMQEEAMVKPDEASWSILETLCHLYDEEQEDFREIKEKFFAERSKSLDWLKSLSNANWDLAYTSEFGTLSAGELFASWVAHDNLALRQFVELWRNRIEKITGPYSVTYAGDW